MANLAGNYTIPIAVIGGFVPAFLWLLFWLREDREHPEPKGLLFITFLIGMASVIFIVPIEQIARANFKESTGLTIMWAALEEFIKYFAVALVALKSSALDEPIDYPIYFITAALGFAAFENTLFLIHPLSVNETTVGLLTGSLRFLGANLLHSTASGLVGISLGLSFYQGWLSRKVHLGFGLAAAVTLHSIFNFFIIKNSGESFFGVFGFLWVATIITLLLFEKVRRLNEIVPSSLPPEQPSNIQTQ
jgi:RsiW-degrading membrane proteinase PrsW (M82 family)